MDNMRFNRLGILVGRGGLQRLAETRVAVFGVGGVGSWTAECLVRSGIGRVDLIDADVVTESNINRQLMALTSTIGMPKAEILQRRLLDINPDADIRVRVDRYNAETADTFQLSDYDYVIDAIDSLADKALLILRATSTPGVKLFSSMGAAQKTDASKIGVAEFWKVKGCPLAAALRHRFKRSGRMPARKFKCVFSEEQAAPRHNDFEADTSGAMMYDKVAVNGAVCHITAIFGMMLASLVFNDVTGRK